NLCPLGIREGRRVVLLSLAEPAIETRCDHVLAALLQALTNSLDKIPANLGTDCEDGGREQRNHLAGAKTKQIVPAGVRLSALRSKLRADRREERELLRRDLGYHAPRERDARRCGLHSHRGFSCRYGILIAM